MKTGKVVIVTGAGRGIGQCLASTYAGNGSEVVLAEIDSESGIRTEEIILSAGQKVIFVKKNVSNYFINGTNI